jgi:AraC-like DNA-binding protein
MHHRGAGAGEIESYLGSRVSFDGGRDRLEFPRAIAQFRLLTADTYLDAFLLDYADRAIASRPVAPTELRTQVENAITPRLPHGTANQSAVAQDLGLGSRTLARRLQEQGITFREILEDLRAELANEYLRNPRLSVAQIAWLLGYSRSSSFARAFRLRTGRPPRRAR